MAAKTKMLTVAVDAYFARAIDEALLVTGTYSSRSEFLKDAIRKNFAQLRQANESMRRIHEEAKKLAKKARLKGYSGGLLTRAERKKITDEYLAENGFQ